MIGGIIDDTHIAFVQHNINRFESMTFESHDARLTERNAGNFRSCIHFLVFMGLDADLPGIINLYDPGIVVLPSGLSDFVANLGETFGPRQYRRLYRFASIRNNIFANVAVDGFIALQMNGGLRVIGYALSAMRDRLRRDRGSTELCVMWPNQ